MLALLLVLTQSPLTVKLNHDQFTSGDHARVYVQSAQDGYLVVLHADPEGRVRVLFPIDPRDDDFMRGGRKFEVRGRADRDAFQIEGEGSGTVLAAVARDPLSFDAFVRNDHWDFRALGGPSSAVRDDPLAKLLDIVQHMAGDSSGRFDYDAATYVAGTSRVAYEHSYYGWDYPYHFGVGFYSPFCGDPFWGWSSCFGYGFGYPYGFGYRVRFGYPIGRPYAFRPYRPAAPRVFTRKAEPRVRYTPIPVRPRTTTPKVGPRGPRGPQIFSQPRSRPTVPRSLRGARGRH